VPFALDRLIRGTERRQPQSSCIEPRVDGSSLLMRARHAVPLRTSCLPACPTSFHLTRLYFRTVLSMGCSRPRRAPTGRILPVTLIYERSNYAQTWCFACFTGRVGHYFAGASRLCLARHDNAERRRFAFSNLIAAGRNSSQTADDQMPEVRLRRPRSGSLLPTMPSHHALRMPRLQALATRGRQV